ncbi:hypothetical protein K402DRAFT_328186 [Aulographum hederae CBS 113979]|uniref:Nuclear distribution protein RO10 n=1 Tax=Aulographum hederae CBS 113979 TaxID=1176131 RepID=A0A6G1H7C8_9PEZI|nr:hypothetical protein K402DRAFT_328186 [Aulographum hederae CBS 113979]
MTQDLDDLLIQTLSLLEWRLRRIEFVLDAETNYESNPGQGTVPDRLQKLEKALQKLATNSPVVSDIIDVYNQFPEVFTAAPDDEGPTLEPHERLAIVLTEAPAFQTTASQLTSLNDLTLPPAEGYAALAALQPRMAAIQERQTEQALEISELRKKSAALLLRWHEVTVLGQGRCWAEWDSRLKQVERTVRREEVKLEREGE